MRIPTEAEIADVIHTTLCHSKPWGILKDGGGWNIWLNACMEAYVYPMLWAAGEFLIVAVILALLLEWGFDAIREGK